MLDTALIEFFAGSILTLVFLERRRCAPLHPSPKPLPLLGNAPQLREKHMWKLATSWAKKTGRTTMIVAVNFLRTVNLSSGKLVYANAASALMIFLNDFQANEDLVNTREDKCDDKPKTVTLNGCATENTW